LHLGYLYHASIKDALSECVADTPPSLHLASRSFLWRQISPRVVPSHWSRDWNRNPLPSNGLSPLPRRLLAPAGVRASDRRLALRGAASLVVVRDEAPELLAGLTGAGALTSLPHSYRVRELHPLGVQHPVHIGPVDLSPRRGHNLTADSNPTQL